MDTDPVIRIARKCLNRIGPAENYIRFDSSNLVLAQTTKPTPIEATVYQPLLCVVLQGEKEVSAGKHRVRCAQGHMILVSHRIPVISQITRASGKKPYIAVILPLDREKLLHYYDLAKTSRIPDESAAIACYEVPADILGALGRLLALDDEPQLAPSLSPLIEDEIHARLLHSEIGSMLARLVWNGDKSAQVTKVIKMLNDDLGNNPSIPELAREAGMSKSALHLHFKSITGMSPLAYTKELRLLKAQTFVRDSIRPISMIGYDVGYNNPAQFSRDYSKKFDVSPRQDRKSVRNKAG